jgi:hypothetical protein
MGGRDQQVAGEHQRVVGVDRRVKHGTGASRRAYRQPHSLKMSSTPAPALAWALMDKMSRIEELARDLTYFL